MGARELNLRSKELLTVSRLRMVKENNEKGRALGRLNVTDKDVAKISQWIEDDAVTQDMYLERLNTLLDLGTQSDKDALASAGLSGAGQELMNIWDEMDRGSLKQDEAFDEADRAVRRRNARMEGEH
jgi:DNA topoisomerase VI subunit A